MYVPARWSQMVAGISQASWSGVYCKRPSTGVYLTGSGAMSSRFEDGVRDDDEPACNSNDDEFVRLSTFFETFGDRHQHLIVRGCGERSGTVRISVCGRAVEHYAAMALMKRSPNRTANWALAMDALPARHARSGSGRSAADCHSAILPLRTNPVLPHIPT